MVDIDTYPTSREDTGEERYGLHLGRLFTSGVIRGAYSSATNGDLKPYGDSTGMVSKVGPGAVFINGTTGEVTGITALSHAAAHASQHRYDRVIARLDRTSPYTIKFLVLTGSTSSTQAGALTAISSVTADDVTLGHVYIAPASSTISAGNVTDNRYFFGPKGTNRGGTLFVPTVTILADSGLTVPAQAITRGEYWVSGHMCKFEISGALSLGGTSTGGIGLALPFPGRNTPIPAKADAFNNVCRALIVTTSGAAKCELYAPSGSPWLVDGQSRGVHIQGEYEI